MDKQDRINKREDKKIWMEVFFRGIVQGVFFRRRVKRAADEFGIFGYVENLPDGSVHLFAYGEKERVRLFLKRIEKDPKDAVIEGISVSYPESGDLFFSFDIRY